MNVFKLTLPVVILASFNFAFANPQAHSVQEEPKPFVTEGKEIEIELKVPNFLPPMERVQDTVEPQFRSNLIRGQ